VRADAAATNATREAIAFGWRRATPTPSDVRHTLALWRVAHSKAVNTGALMSAARFREFAAEHLDWARTATSDRERETFEQMARAWLEVAAVWDDAIAEGGKLDSV
jgi:hypothetical protein